MSSTMAHPPHGGSGSLDGSSFLVCSMRSCGAPLTLFNKKRNRDRRPTYQCARGHFRKTCPDCGKQGEAKNFSRHVCKANGGGSSSRSSKRQEVRRGHATPAGGGSTASSIDMSDGASVSSHGSSISSHKAGSVISSSGSEDMSSSAASAASVVRRARIRARASHGGAGGASGALPPRAAHGGSAQDIANDAARVAVHLARANGLATVRRPDTGSSPPFEHGGGALGLDFANVLAAGAYSPASSSHMSPISESDAQDAYTDLLGGGLEDGAELDALSCDSIDLLEPPDGSDLGGGALVPASAGGTWVGASGAGGAGAGTAAVTGSVSTSSSSVASAATGSAAAASQVTAQEIMTTMELEDDLGALMPGLDALVAAEVSTSGATAAAAATTTTTTSGSAPECAPAPVSAAEGANDGLVFAEDGDVLISMLDFGDDLSGEEDDDDMLGGGADSEVQPLLAAAAAQAAAASQSKPRAAAPPVLPVSLLRQSQLLAASASAAAPGATTPSAAMAAAAAANVRAASAAAGVQGQTRRTRMGGDGAGGGAGARAGGGGASGAGAPVLPMTSHDVAELAARAKAAATAASNGSASDGNVFDWIRGRVSVYMGMFFMFYCVSFLLQSAFQGGNHANARSHMSAPVPPPPAAPQQQPAAYAGSSEGMGGMDAAMPLAAHQNAPRPGAASASATAAPAAPAPVPASSSPIIIDSAQPKAESVSATGGGGAAAPAPAPAPAPMRTSVPRHAPMPASSADAAPMPARQKNGRGGAFTSEAQGAPPMEPMATASMEASGVGSVAATLLSSAVVAGVLSCVTLVVYRHRQRVFGRCGAQARRDRREHAPGRQPMGAY